MDESERVVIKTTREEVSPKSLSHMNNIPTPLTATVSSSPPSIDSSIPVRPLFYPAASISANRNHVPCKSVDEIPTALKSVNNPKLNKTVRKTSVAGQAPFVAMVWLARSESISLLGAVVKDKDLRETLSGKKASPLPTKLKASYEFEHNTMPKAAQVTPLMKQVLQALADSFLK